MTVADDGAVSACNLPDFVYKGCHPPLVRGPGVRLAFGQTSATLPTTSCQHLE